MKLLPMLLFVTLLMRKKLTAGTKDKEQGRSQIVDDKP
jgi:hypothetical protein